ncbi:hypothetical protein DYD21_00530 [Rhodohalobacter sp. SW132]|uniref:hypothetical protein n=1 Tax=Rhodohalobacter sp. SW132 TaxID=2293433 RepID=UPI000E374A38|nr:hypothetical protein [Rhodohalobacter sp. SW132]REL38470.1 hypothetical protein DYD21_00530 [Rhodohalobacter sp. SW132]
MKQIKLLLTFLLFISFVPAFVLAQNEIERERISLEGLQEFGFTANIEGSRTIADSETLTPSVIRQDAINRLLNADLRYVADEEVHSSADIPFLYMHINAMEMENGLIPFSIELRLYQPVKLTLNRDMQTSASTWETGMVGLVSYDRLPVINQAAQNLLDTFIEDYHQSNRSRSRN